MSLPNTDSLTTGFPLVIPTSTQQPSARLVLRNDRGQVVQQWLVKQNKCTLGSASSCGLRCDLPGIAPYHALLVIGARQVFIRALAPKLTRNNRPFNEILLTEEESHFEIAGHRFELSRKRDAVSTGAQAERSKQERLKFTLARPFELSGRKAPVTTIVADTPTVQPATSLNPANMDPRWVAQLIQSAIEPLESQLNNLLQPLNELQSESRKMRRLRKKRQASKPRNAQHLAADAAGLPHIAPQMSQQVEDLVVKHSAAMDVLTERISDVNQQLSAIERIIAAEREESKLDSIPAEDPKLTRQSQAIEQLQNGIVTVTATLQSLQSQQSQEWDHELEWKSNIQEQLAGVTQVVDSLAATVSEVHTLASRQISTEQVEQDRRAEQQWKVDVQQRLTGLCQVIDGLSLNVNEIHTSTLSEATPEQKQQHEEEQRWQTDVKQQLLGLNETIASLSSSVAEVHRSATAEPSAEDLQLQQQQRHDELEWKSSVQQQLSSLSQVVDNVSANLTTLQTTTLQEIAQRQLMPAQPDDQVWQSELREQLSDMSRVIDRLSANVAEITTTTLHDQTPAESASQQAADQQWQSELRLQLTDMRRVIDGLSANVADMHTTTRNDQVELQTVQAQATDHVWQSEFRQQLGDLSQVIDSLSVNMAEMYSTALNEHVSRQSATTVDSEWQVEVRQQLAGLSQVVDALSATVTEVHKIATSDIAAPNTSLPANDQPASGEFWAVSGSPGTSRLEQIAVGRNPEQMGEDFRESGDADETDIVETSQSVCNLRAANHAVREREGEPVGELEVDYQVDEAAAFDADQGLTTELADDSDLDWPESFPTAAPQAALWELPAENNSQDEFLFGGQPLTTNETDEPSAVTWAPAADEHDEPIDDSRLASTMPAGSAELPAQMPADSAWSTQAARFSIEQEKLAEPEDSSYSWEVAAPPADESSLWSVPQDDKQESHSSQSARIEQLDDTLPSWWQDETEQDAEQSPAAVSESESAGSWSFENLPVVEAASDSPQAHETNSVLKDVEVHDETVEGHDVATGIVPEDSEEFFGLNQYQSPAELNGGNFQAVDVDRAKPEFDMHATWDDELVGGLQPSEALDGDDLIEQSWPSQLQPAEAALPNLPEIDLEDTVDAPIAGITTAQLGTEEDDSVEDYMRKLLARMRGVPEESAELTPATPAPPQSNTKAAEKATPQSTVETESNVGGAPRTTVARSKTEVDSLEVTEPFDPEKYMPRALAPERTQSLAAMRELANSSARTAIHRSTRQRHVSSIVLKAVIATVGLTVGMVLVAINGLNVNIGLVATVASFLVAAIWGYDSLTSIRPMLQAGLILRPEASVKTAPAEQASERTED